MSPDADKALALAGEGVARLNEHAVRRVPLARGQLLHVVTDDVVLPDGSLSTREFVVHPGAVMVVPLLDDGRVLLERQYRHPMGRVMIEFPAGKLDAHEPSLACAQRELREETGFSAQEWAHAATIHPVISYSTEHIDIWFARGLTEGSRQLDPGEFVETFFVSPQELIHWCATGEVTDAKTLAGAWWLQNVLSGHWSLNWWRVGTPCPPVVKGPFVPPVGQHRP